jgi:hypothetical protein
VIFWYSRFVGGNKVIRILTEDKKREMIYDILRQRVDAYSITEMVGSWKGVQEKSLAIDLVNCTMDTAKAIATELKFWNKQDAVLILEIPTTETWV